MSCPRCGGRGWVREAGGRYTRCPCLAKPPVETPGPPREKFNPPPPESAFDTLGLAQQKVRAGLADGVECPCCGRLAKRYKRKLNSQMAAFIVLLYRHLREHPPGTAAHVRSFMEDAGHKASSDGTYLVHWELIDPGQNQGEWLLTPKGERFARGMIRVPRHVYLFNNQREGFSDDSTSVREALGDRFDYDELMGAR